MSVDRLRQRLQLAEDALRTLDELAFLANPTRIERDAAIQRFEYTVEAIWKAGLAEYDQMEGIAWRWQSIDAAMFKAPLAQEAVGGLIL